MEILTLHIRIISTQYNNIAGNTARRSEKPAKTIEIERNQKNTKYQWSKSTTSTQLHSRILKRYKT